MTDIARRTRLIVVYAGTDISHEISGDLLSFTYTDNEGGKSDDVAITLKNDHGLWSGAWLPARGDKIMATIWQEGDGAGLPLQCGVFTVDEIEVSGPPSTAAIKGISVPSNSDIFRRKSSRAWEQVRLSEIAQDVAGKGELAMQFLPDNDPLFDRRDQRDETDMAFLKRLCDAEAFAVKCTDEQIVIFSPEEQSKEPPVYVLINGMSDIKSYRFSAQNHDVYWKCTVEYTDPKTGKVNKFTHEQEGMDKGKEKKIVERASSLADAERMAKAGLYDANRNEVTAAIDLVGNTHVMAGVNIAVVGFGRFDGKYYVKAATHTVSNGYTTSLELSNTRDDSGEPDVYDTPNTES